jgi:hypothetical protein
MKKTSAARGRDDHATVADLQVERATRQRDLAVRALGPTCQCSAATLPVIPASNEPLTDPFTFLARERIVPTKARAVAAAPMADAEDGEEPLPVFALLLGDPREDTE